MMLLAAAVGSAFGASLRYGAEVTHARWHARRPDRTRRLDVPVATLGVNVVGSALLGAVAGLASHDRLSDVAVALLGAGLAGGLTTFSTFAVDAVQLVVHRRWRRAILYVTVTLAAGLAAAVGGYWVASGGA